jgi:hypothetical protein
MRSYRAASSLKSLAQRSMDDAYDDLATLKGMEIVPEKT